MKYMTLVNAADLLIAQIEKAMSINGRLRAEAFSEGDETEFNRLERFSRRLNSLHSKAIVARAEVTDLSIHGCVAVTSEERIDMKKIKAVAACDVAAFCRKIEDKLVDILKLDPPEQKDAIETLLDFVQDMEFDLDSEIDPDEE